MLDKVVDALNRNEIVCFPTETVYALACNARSEEALSRLYKIKKRDIAKPFSILCRDLVQVAALVELTDFDLKVLTMLTPGPVTFVLPMRPKQNLPSSFFRDSLGVRIPDHKLASAVLGAVSYPLAATSANISGISDAVRAVCVPEEIRECVSEFWDDDSSVGGVCSTVFDLAKRSVLRAGMLQEQEIFNTIKTVQRKYYGHSSRA